MQVSRFIAPIVALVSAIGDALAKDSDRGRRITAGELLDLRDKALAVLGAEAQRDVAIGDDILVRIGGSDEDPELRPGKVVRVWGPTCVNAQVFVDGDNDARWLAAAGLADRWIWWATSINEGAGLREWRRP